MLDAMSLLYAGCKELVVFHWVKHRRAHAFLLTCELIINENSNSIFIFLLAWFDCCFFFFVAVLLSYYSRKCSIYGINEQFGHGVICAAPIFNEMVSG